jgi:hypothetical protein
MLLRRMYAAGRQSTIMKVRERINQDPLLVRVNLAANQYPHGQTVKVHQVFGFQSSAGLAEDYRRTRNR